MSAAYCGFALLLLVVVPSYPQRQRASHRERPRIALFWLYGRPQNHSKSIGRTHQTSPDVGDNARSPACYTDKELISHGTRGCSVLGSDQNRLIAPGSIIYGAYQGRPCDKRGVCSVSSDRWQDKVSLYNIGRGYAVANMVHDSSSSTRNSPPRLCTVPTN